MVKRYIKNYFGLVLCLLLLTLQTPSQADDITENIFINSPELSELKKVKNIRNKKGKRNKDGIIYVGQKGLIFWNGYGI